MPTFFFFPQQLFPSLVYILHLQLWRNQQERHQVLRSGPKTEKLNKDEEYMYHPSINHFDANGVSIFQKYRRVSEIVFALSFLSLLQHSHEGK
jgi:hypothetical protein